MGANTGLVVAGIAGGVAIVLLWLGLRAFFLPWRLIVRPGRMLAQRIGPLTLLLSVVWTVALAPTPFFYLWSWLAGLGRALLYETPSHLVTAEPILAAQCAKDGPGCGTLAMQILGLMWKTAIGNPVGVFEVPPGSAQAALLFACALTAAALWRRAAAQPDFARPWLSGRFGRASGLALAFISALYLCIVAILAVPVFEDQTTNIADAARGLQEKLGAMTPKAAPAFRTVAALDRARQDVPVSVTTAAAATTPASTAMLFYDNEWKHELEDWDTEKTALDDRSRTYLTDAAAFEEHIVTVFADSNKGVPGATETERHAGQLVEYYERWLRTSANAIDRCADGLRRGLDALKTRAFAARQYAASGGSDTGLLDTLSKPDQDQEDPEAVCHQQPADDLPVRPDVAHQLGLFGYAAGWLIQTNSQALGLIVGLLGFGFFGALAASFVREYKAGNPALPSSAFVVPALVRGFGAAILVFLVAKGGVALFTKGDATPNAYVIFFACFVGAVFSDDVWDWARRRQQAQFGEGEPGDRPAPETKRLRPPSRP